MDELKPCPFCGGHARMNIVMDSVGVSCRLCGASLIDETREDAIAAWNARAPVVPEGWVLVPRVPDHALEDVFCEAWEDEKESLIATEGSYALAELFKAAWSAMLAAAAKVQTVPEGWRDISSVPENTWVLAGQYTFNPEHPDARPVPNTMRRIGEVWHWETGNPASTSPTHWMPLPAAPKVPA